jgi:hypothetical protein
MILSVPSSGRSSAIRSWRWDANIWSVMTALRVVIPLWILEGA